MAAIHVDSEQHSEKRAFFATLFFCLVCTSLKKHMLGLLVSAISPVSEERFRGNGRRKKKNEGKKRSSHVVVINSRICELLLRRAVGTEPGLVGGLGGWGLCSGGVEEWDRPRKTCILWDTAGSWLRAVCMSQQE